MSLSATRHGSATESEDEPDEDPKVMLLVEAGRVPGLDDSLRHLQYRYKKKKKKIKRRKRSEGESRETKKAKREDSNIEQYVLSGIITNLNKPGKYEAYRNCLMISEWLVKVPDDFDDNWIMVPCPTGKRMLVIATAGSTRCFAKSGEFMFYFQSALPGGHLVGSDESSKSMTVLDCIWHHEKKTYYILDALSWNNSHLLHCEASFRFFWLEQKMSELDTILEETEENHYRFFLLPRAQCRKDKLVDVMTKFCVEEEFKESIDGFLFYNQNAPYFSGTSSTVGWLKPFMVAEVFNTSVTSELSVHLPNDYKGLQEYINEFQKNKKRVIRRERKLKRQRLGLEPAFTVIEKETKCNETEIENEDVIFEDSEVKQEETITDQKTEYRETIECESSLVNGNGDSGEHLRNI